MHESLHGADERIDSFPRISFQGTLCRDFKLCRLMGHSACDLTRDGTLQIFPRGPKLALHLGIRGKVRAERRTSAANKDMRIDSAENAIAFSRGLLTYLADAQRQSSAALNPPCGRGSGRAGGSSVRCNDQLGVIRPYSKSTRTQCEANPRP